MAYQSIKISKGSHGWGGPLVITPTESKKYIYSITGGGIHPVAQRIAELTGAEAIDGMKKSIPFDEMAVAVIDCGGSARVGVYPMKKVFTVDVNPASPSGLLANYITEDLFVSGVTINDIEEYPSD